MLGPTCYVLERIFQHTLFLVPGFFVLKMKIVKFVMNKIYWRTHRYFSLSILAISVIKTHDLSKRLEMEKHMVVVGAWSC